MHACSATLRRAPPTTTTPAHLDLCRPSLLPMLHLYPTPLPCSYLQGSQSPRTHGQGGEGVQVVVSVGWEFVSLGKRSYEGGP